MVLRALLARVAVHRAREESSRECCMKEEDWWKRSGRR